jgi:transcriptional regulator with XRE-family HTH domain
MSEAFESHPSAATDWSMIKRDTSTQLRAHIGEQLRRARIKSGKRQSDLATELNMNQGHISEVERGLLNITLDTLSNLAAAVGHTPTVILNPDPPAKASKNKKA